MKRALSKRQAAAARAELVRQRAIKRSGDRAYIDLHFDGSGRPFFSANALYGDGGRQSEPFPSRQAATIRTLLLAAEHDLEVGE